ncbi:YeaC family protein [Carnimonas nigrificans]|uniref:YeaC family protein n=1 Tax=Carnimonas nigrificans TaxID=64323 RepID=UPI00046E9F7C|nr:DUF1315 family protein [Carnimonas nigrificans]
MSDMTFDDLAGQMTPATHLALKQAVELRKWPDGRKLSREQLELCLEAIIKYENTHQFEEEERTGYIDRSRHPQQDQLHSEASDDGDDIKWVKQ